MTDAAAAVESAYQRINDGRLGEALAVIAPLAALPDAPHAVLAAHAAALKAAFRMDEALEVYRLATVRFPESAIAWHNYAGMLDDLGRAKEAREAVGRAFALGLDAAETWLVLARVSLNLMDHAEAERAYRQVLKRQPTNDTAAQELARLVWLNTADWTQALQPIQSALRAGANHPNTLMIAGKILEAADRRAELHDLFDAAIARFGPDPVLTRAAAHAWLEEDELDKASALAESAVEGNPTYIPGLIELTAVRLAQGRAHEALAMARRATETAPQDQSTWGWLATAARAAGDPVYEALYDYDAFVRAYQIETPPGWSSLEAYLADLETVLRELHVFKVHPADQSLRNGTQTNVELGRYDHPAVKAFFTALQAPIQAYMAELGSGSDPLRSRNTGRFNFMSAWSVLLKPNGFHVNHFHPMGWLSSAFYIRVPKDAIDAPAREGWIKFGEPPFKTAPPQPAAHFVKPEPGRLVLFPSYMWHGTVPFTTQEDRLTIAFDVVPA